MNRLAGETSPYLLQHKHNPVDWWPWGTEALAEAKRANKPILLSVGYAACHWCHVMAHESFEDAATAQVMNDLFVNIKVDREERPDIDQIYMSALHHLGEHGGWPLTMFLTPDGEPFWGGTYFPKTSRYGKPAFINLLRVATGRLQSGVVVYSCALAGLGGALYAALYSLEPTLGSLFILKAVEAAILAGIGSVTGALLGGVILGVTEGVGSIYLPLAFRDAYGLVFLVLILLFKPAGLFAGRR